MREYKTECYISDSEKEQPINNVLDTEAKIKRWAVRTEEKALSAFYKKKIKSRPSVR